ncbi:MAG: hypothetical protein LBH39_01395 [Clostridiales Family XIII bacterium]|nr:hypothetical protein [Clostridiales Family XIII bacterium]
MRGVHAKGQGVNAIRITSNRPGRVPERRKGVSGQGAVPGRGGISGQGAVMRCRVTHQDITGRLPGRPDWDKIPSKAQSPLSEGEWEGLIRRQAREDAARGMVMPGHSRKLLVAYVSRFSPDRRRMYEALFAKYGDKLESYRSGDGANMRNIKGVWKFDMTPAETRSAARFMKVYIDEQRQ